MVSRIGLLCLWLCSFSAVAAAQEITEFPAGPKVRQYLLSNPLARPVVRILSDDYEGTGRYRNATGVLVGRCDVVLTARHVALSGKALNVETLDVYSPQIRGKTVDVVDDPAARALWPRGPVSFKDCNLDDDLAVLKLSACPTKSFVPLHRIRAIRFNDFKSLKTVGFACDSADERAPEIIAMRGRFQQVDPSLGVSRSILLTPGARSGQSGSPIYAIPPSEEPALTMIMVATVRDTAAPAGCGKDPKTGRSKAGISSYGAVLSSAFIEALGGYVQGLEGKGHSGSDSQSHHHSGDYQRLDRRAH